MSVGEGSSRLVAHNVDVSHPASLVIEEDEVRDGVRRLNHIGLIAECGREIDVRRSVWSGSRFQNNSSVGSQSSAQAKMMSSSKCCTYSTEWGIVPALYLVKEW